MVKLSDKILVPVDGSESSRAAVEYVGRMLRGNNDLRVRLLNVLDPIRPFFRNLSGSLQPREPEEPVSTAEADLIAHAQEQAKPVLQDMASTLADAGVDPEQIEFSWYVMAREDYLHKAVLEVAEQGDFGTIVVGHSSLPWYRELMHQHLGKKLVKEAEGRAVWVIE